MTTTSTGSLTQAEAETRGALLRVERYDIEVDLTDLPTGPEVRCVSTVTFRCEQPGATTFVDCVADVRAASLDDVPLGPASDGRLELPDLREHNVLRVESVQRETSRGQGVHKAVDPSDGEVYLWTSFEPDEARMVWACFDQPDLKAPHAFTVTAPAGWTVLSNSGGAEVEDLGEARRWTFPATPPLSTYNPVVNAGPFHEIRREVDGYDLGLYGRRSMAGVLDRDADELFTVTAQGLAFFAEAFSMPFPQRKYDQVFVPDFGGAMENYGCVTWSDALLRWSTPTPAERQLVARVLLHEMAHMWFGNIVTMRWWDDLWLNEAFAEFAANWAAASATDYSDAWATHLAGEKLRAYLADQGPTSHPIRQPVPDVATAASTFDAITYPKGASTLRQLMTYVGEDRFRAGMSDYFARHAWGNTTLQDLVDAIARAAGRDLEPWRRGWLETAGTDRLTLDRGPEGGGEGLTLVARGPDGPPRPQVLGVGAYRRDDAGGLTREALATVEVSGERTAVELPADAALYLVNDDDLTFASVRPDADTRDALFADAALLPTAVSRGVAVATARDMLVGGEASAEELVRCVSSVLAVETSHAVVEPYLVVALEATELWSPDARRDELRTLVADACRSLLSVDGLRQVALRGLARTAGSPAELDEVRALVDDGAVDDTDVAWHALTRAAQLGQDTAAEVARLLERDSDPAAEFRAMAVRAATPDPEAKAEVWQAVAVDRSVPVGLVNPVTTAFWSPGQDEVLAPYPQRYVDGLGDLAGGGMVLAMHFTSRLFPLFAVDRAFLDGLPARVADASPIVRKNVAERADIVSRMLRSRAGR